MAKGSDAKQRIIAKIKELYGKDFIGESNNKYYLWEKDNGERVQIAISLTCPKTQIGESDCAFTQVTAVPVKKEAPEITKEETDNIAKLMEELGL